MPRLSFALLYCLAMTILLAFVAPPWYFAMLEAQTRIDLARQATNVPITNQTTQLTTIFEPDKQVAAPAVPGLPCASGTWAKNQNHLFLCFEPRADSSFGWVRIATERY